MTNKVIHLDIPDSLYFTIDKIKKSNSKKHLVFFADSNKEARKIYDNLRFFSDEDIVYFPDFGTDPFDNTEASSVLCSERASALVDLGKKRDKGLIVISTIEACMGKIVNPLSLKDYSFEVNEGQELSSDDLSLLLAEFGYDRVDVATRPSEYSVKGEVFDIAISSNQGFRIVFEFDKVDKIKKFNCISQVSEGESLKSIELKCCTEIIVNQSSVDNFVKNTRKMEINPLDKDMIVNLSHASPWLKYYHLLADKKTNSLPYWLKDNVIFATNDSGADLSKQRFNEIKERYNRENEIEKIVIGFDDYFDYRFQDIVDKSYLLSLIIH